MKWIILGLLVVPTVVQAQTVRAQGPRGHKAVPAYRPAQPYNSLAKDTTPFNCEQYRRHPHPGMVGYCESVEQMTLRNEARRQGRPGSSDSVVRLPGLGTPEARELGVACVNGQALRKLSNGWEQVMAAGGGWQRCTGG